jgi:hypothetical protein
LCGDIGRRIAGDDALEEVFARELSLARRVLAQDRHQRGRKVYQSGLWQAIPLLSRCVRAHYPGRQGPSQKVAGSAEGRQWQ